jgi:hypothetical protein
MHQLLEILNRQFVGGNVENFFEARIYRSYPAARIVPPRPELNCIESKLQTVFTRLQFLLKDTDAPHESRRQPNSAQCGTPSGIVIQRPITMSGAASSASTSAAFGRGNQ